MKNNFSHVGKPVIRRDALAKATGQALFADDYHYPNQLSGIMVRVPVAHAEIQSIDYGSILSHPSVVAVCDWRDIPGDKKTGILKKDQPIFAFDKIVTPGDVVAMLIGENEANLNQLKNLVKISYQELPILNDPQKALLPEAPLIHPEFGSNLIVHYPLRKGDIEQGFAESDFILEQTYTTPHVEHAYIEPECVIAFPIKGNQGVEIIGSIQNPFTTRRIVASVLNLPLTLVRVKQAELGGSFGGKDDTMNILSARAAVGAMKTGCPVKIRYCREESIAESYKRHPYHMNYKVGFKKNGKITAMKIDILADGGAYASMSPFVTWRSVVQATGPYEIENVWTDVRAVYTNNPYTGAMRGFGSPQPIFAQESIMDEIAVKLGMTPDTIRKINGFRPGSITASGQKLADHDVNLLEILDTAVQKTDFQAKWKTNFNHNLENSNRSEFAVKSTKNSLILGDTDFLSTDQLLRKGIGLAISFRGCSLGAEGIDAAAAYISIQADGSVYLLSGLAENGQGLRTTFSIIAAEVLGIAPEDIVYLEQDTGLIPDSGPTVASRSTLMGGGAVKSAAEIVRQRLEKLVRNLWKINNEAEIIFKDHSVCLEGNTTHTIPFTELCQTAYNQGISLAALGWYQGPRVDWDESIGQGPAYFTYVYGCQVAEVTVNLGTGEVYVDRVTAVHNPGKVINLLGARGQVFGGVTQGAGYGLYEEISTKDGFIRELNFDQFLIPTSKDIGEIVPIFIEGKDQYGPWGAKSLGEPTLELTAAAIANAVRNAVGKRFFNLPLNLEEILLQKKLRPENLNRGSS